jgi:hypothetical protein
LTFGRVRSRPGSEHLVEHSDHTVIVAGSLGMVVWRTP